MFDVRITLTPDAQAPAGARRAIEGLRPIVGARLADETALLVSELVTNSVRHARLLPDQAIQVRVEAEPERVLVSVHDEGPGFDPASTERRADGGLGLHLLDRIADRWGVRHDRETTVWFELARPLLTAR